MSESRRIHRLLADRALQESLLASLLILLGTAGLSLVVSAGWVLRQALREGPVSEADTLLVCGHRLQAGQPSDDYRQRLERAAEWLRQGRAQRLILLGGGKPSEAAAGRDWLTTHAALDEALIELEEQSIDSFENLHNARMLLAPGERVALLSSRYHLGRLNVFARQLRLQIELVPAESRLPPTPRTALRIATEALYLCWFVSGRAWARLARRKHLLDRLG